MDTYFPYLRNSFRYTPRSNYILNILSILEFLPMWFLTLSCTNALITINQSTQTWSAFPEAFHIKWTLIPKLQSVLSFASSREEISNWTSLIIIVINSAFILFFVLYFLIWRYWDSNDNNIDKSKRKGMIFQFNTIVITFYDCFYFRWFSVYTLFSLLNIVFYSSFLYCFLSLLLTIIHFIISLFYFTLIKNEICFYPEGKQRDKYPYNSFTSQNDLVGVLLKLFLVLHCLTLTEKGEYSSYLDESLNLVFSCLSIATSACYVYAKYIIFIFSPADTFYHSTNKFNSLKLFFTTYLVNISIWDLLLNISSNKALYFLSHSITLFMAIILTYSVHCTRWKRIIRSKSPLSSIWYLIEIFNFFNNDLQVSQYKKRKIFMESHHDASSNDIEYIIQIKDISFNHIVNCTKKEEQTCALCEFINENIKDKNTSIKLEMLQLINLFYENYQQNKQTPKRETLQDMIETFTNINNNNDNYFSWSIFYTNQLNYLRKANPTLGMSLRLFYSTVLRRTINENSNTAWYEQVSYIKENENRIVTINGMIKIWEDLSKKIYLSPIHMINNSALLLESQKRLLKSVFEVKNNNQNAFNEYQSVIIRYVVENWFNKKGKINNNFNIMNYDSFLEEHYNTDKFFLLKYHLTNNSFIIYQAGKDFINCINKNFLSLFPFSDIANKKLMEIWKDSRNKAQGFYEYPIRNIKHEIHGSDFTSHWMKSMKTQVSLQGNPLNSNGNNNNNNNVHVSSFIMKPHTYPAIDVNEMFIHINYKKDYNNVLITKTNVASPEKQSEEIIVNYSKQLTSYWGIPITIFNSFNASNINIKFTELFQKKTGEELVLIYNKGKYLNKLHHLFQEYLENKVNLTEEEKDIFSNLKCDWRTVNADVKICKTESHLSEDGKTKIKFYYFKKAAIPNKNSVKGQTNISEDKDNDEDLFDNFNFLSAVTNHSMMSSYQQTSSQFTKTNSHGESTVISTWLRSNPELYQQYLEEKRLKKAQNRQFFLFALLIFISNSVWIWITILFLILEITYNNNFQNSFAFFQDFNEFYRLFMGQAINLLYDVCISRQNVLECKPSFNNYSIEIMEPFGLDKEFNVNDWIMYELTIKLNYYNPMLSNIKEKVYDSKDKIAIAYGDGWLKYQYLSIETKDGVDVVQINEKDESLFYLLNTYASLFNIIVLEKGLMWVPIHIITIKGNEVRDIDTSNMIFYEDPLLRKIQVTYYQILLNFRRIFNSWRGMRIRINEINTRNINVLKDLAIVFSILLICLHFLLMCLCSYLFIIFIRIMQSNFSEAMKRINDKRKVFMLREKLSFLKCIMLMYMDNPWSIITKYSNIKSKHRADDKKINGEKKNPLEASETSALIKKIRCDDIGARSIVAIKTPKSNRSGNILNLLCIQYHLFDTVSRDNRHLSNSLQSVRNERFARCFLLHRVHHDPSDDPDESKRLRDHKVLERRNWI